MPPHRRLRSRISICLAPFLCQPVRAHVRLHARSYLQGKRGEFKMTAHLKRTAALALTLLLAIHLATLARQAKRYTVTVFVDEGPQTAGEQLRAARGASRDANSSGTIVKTGHVFIGLSNGDINTYLGFFGNQEKGQVRVDADLVQNGYYNVSKTYEISEANYHAALAVATQWNTDGKRWALDHHCGDFAEAVARADRKSTRLNSS